MPDAIIMFLASYGISEVFSGFNDLGGDRQSGPRLNNNLFFFFSVNSLTSHFSINLTFLSLCIFNRNWCFPICCSGIVHLNSEIFVISHKAAICALKTGP